MIHDNDVSRLLKRRGLSPHYEKSTAEKKVRWDFSTGIWVAVHWRPSFASFRVEFADPERVLGPGLKEVGNQFNKNGGRNIEFDPASAEPTKDVLSLTEEWLAHYTKPAMHPSQRGRK